jgi:cyclophilin family peptidyl-prolyl cis-trans isomerase
MGSRIIIAVAVVIVIGLVVSFIANLQPARVTAEMQEQTEAAETRLENAPDVEMDDAAEPAGDADQTAQPAENGKEMSVTDFQELSEAPTAEDGGVPETFYVKYECTMGDFVVAYHRDWAPRGVKQVYEIVRDDVHDGARFFRVVPDFVVQWGIPADPDLAAEWRDRTIPDDPVKQSNTRGMVTFATSGKDSRSNQMFINFGDNAALDAQGFSPVGEVVDGMENVDQVEDKYSRPRPEPNQAMVQRQGEAYLQENFPDLDTIKRTVFVKPAE